MRFCIPGPLRLPPKLRRRARRHRMATLLLLLLVPVLLVAPFYIIYKPSAALISHFARRWPDVLWQVDLPPSAGKVVALTIDDAPSQHTIAILAALRFYGAKATFFVIGGQVAGREQTLQLVAREGHELANHAMRDEPARALPDEELEEQIRRVEGMIGEAYRGADREAEEGARYFRPGSGFFSDRMRALVRRIGYRLVLGGIYPHDAQIGSAWLNARHVLSMVRPGGIIICHDRRAWTAPMLRRVLPELRRRGYKVVTVSELLRLGKGA